MAKITKVGSTYRISVSLGYDECGFEVIQSKPFKPRRGMSEKQIAVELEKAAALFVEKCKQDHTGTVAKPVYFCENA